MSSSAFWLIVLKYRRHLLDLGVACWKKKKKLTEGDWFVEFNQKSINGRTRLEKMKEWRTDK